MLYLVYKIKERINGRFSIIDIIDRILYNNWSTDREKRKETFTNFLDALDYMNVKAKAWREVSQTINTLEWYRVSIEEN